MDEEELMEGAMSTYVPPQESDDDWAKSGRFVIIDDFEDEEYAEDDFNYDNYKKQQMLW